MKQLYIALGALALAATLSAQTAKADTFNFNFGTAQDSHSGSGTITGDQIGNGEFSITSITGTTDGFAITGLADSGAVHGNDNFLFFPLNSNEGVFDNGGLAFFVDLGSGQQADVNLFEGNGSISRVIFEGQGIAGVDTPEPITVTPQSTAPSPVPEPSSICLLGTGVLGVAGIVRRRLTR